LKVGVLAEKYISNLADLFEEDMVVVVVVSN
jgi:hypothetical protein